MLNPRVILERSAMNGEKNLARQINEKIIAILTPITPLTNQNLNSLPDLIIFYKSIDKHLQFVLK